MDPSSGMQTMGLALQLGAVARVHANGTFDDLAGVRESPLNTFDAVVVSASLPYGFHRKRNGAAALARAVGDRIRAGGHFLAIEPEAKKWEMDGLQAALEATGISVERFSSTALPAHVRRGRRMTKLTKAIRDMHPELDKRPSLTDVGRLVLGTKGAYPIEDWNDSRKTLYMLASR